MIRFSLAGIVALCVAVVAHADQGNPKLKSIEKLAFGPDGMLLIGDSKGSQVISVDTGDLKAAKWGDTATTGIDGVLAGKLGLTAKDIQILKLTVNPVSGKAYVAVRNLKMKQDVLLTIDGAGKVEEFSLENVKFNRYALTVNDKAVTTITDVVWAGDRILASGKAGDKFASRVFSITPGVKDAAPTCYSAETYHVAHTRWETHAPMATIIPYEENGKRYFVGAYTCTPIVKYAMDDMKPNAQVKGTSIVELGSGNTPRDMFVYEKNGKKSILISTIRFQKTFGPTKYWAARVDYDLLKETKNVDQKALWRIKPSDPGTDIGDRAVIAKDYFGVQFMSKLDDARALVIREEEKGGLSLRVLTLP
ncbi:MAG: hypothetical protein HY289_10220 [Planctomycetes bacterium]|nr:hypothetical protein [Planctomycetota bacterium]